MFDVIRNEFGTDLGREDKITLHAAHHRISINLKSLTLDEIKTQIVKDNDLLSNRVHRHEPPVTSELPKIVVDDEKYFVVNKPSSIPIHPVSHYRHNSLIFLLAREYNVNYHVVHRLDRLTSGLVILAKTKDVSKKISKEITDRLVSKEYICRVVGHFPTSAACSVPLYVLSARKGISQVATTPETVSRSKNADTLFELISYDEGSNESIVRARPKTGRTHQIRVHLQYLGYPIRNDPIYNDPVFGSERFEHEKQKLLTEEEILTGMGKTRGWGENMYRLDSSNENAAVDIDPICDKCNEPPADPKHEDLILYLHAYKYSGPDWSFETDLPYWAEQNYKSPDCYTKYDS